MALRAHGPGAPELRRPRLDRTGTPRIVFAPAGALGSYGPAHSTSEAQRHVRARLAVRDALVRTRAPYLALAKALVRREGRGSGGP